MILHDDSNGIEITLAYDGDGFPTVDINTGGGFMDEKDRPTVEVTINGTTIHKMFELGGESDDSAVAELGQHQGR